MTLGPIQISKSQYIRGKQCPLSLWNALHRRDLATDADAARAAILATGRDIGEWAKQRFPGGVELKAPFFDHVAGAAETKTLVDAGNEIIFEATAVHPADGTHARADILKKVPGTDGWDLIEVKGSTGVKDYHLDDMSFQYRIFTAAGYRINQCFMMLINNEYVRTGEIEPAQLFKLEDITGSVIAAQAEIEAVVPLLQVAIEEKEEPPRATIGARCFKPFDCEYMTHCWKGVPDYSIYNVFSGNKADEIVESLGSYEVKSLPSGLFPKGTKSKDISSYIKDEVYVDPDNIRRFLADLRYPLYYLDYETIAAAIPIFDGTRPFQNIPFQFSLHIEREVGADLQHFEFLHKKQTDPRQAFIEDLVRLCGTEGSIIVYHQTFEKGVNASLMQDFPQYADAVGAINARMVDLLVPFKNRWLYHPKQHGSASIKKVLPAFTDLSYEGISISNGQDASQRYLDFMQQKVPELEVHRLWDALSEYCGLDTFAMKILLDVLKKRSMDRR